MAAILNYTSYLKSLEEICKKFSYAPVPDEVLTSFIKQSRIDINFGITLADVKQDMFSIIKRYADPIPNRLKPSPWQPPASMAKLNTYSEYLRALEKLYADGGYVTPSDDSLRDFIRCNEIDKVYKITLRDVKTDIRSIEANHRGQLQRSAHNQRSSITKNRNGLRIAQYKDYLQALREWYLKYKDQMYLETKAQEFISSYCLDIDFGITADELREDILALSSGKEPSNKHSIGKAMLNGDKCSLDAVITYCYDAEMEKKFVQILMNHPNSLDNKKILAALIRDYFPTSRKEANIMIMLLNNDIASEIRAIPYIDNLFYSRLIKQATELGIERKLAENIVKLWCVGYGKTILHKKCDL